jgi:hypothetical protein
MSNQSLHSWLQAEESAGTLDSRGEFTIEQSKAWEKLGTFQLPFAEAWILKLVQAAMASSQTQLVIKQTREETSFIFSQGPTWSRHQVEAAVFNPSTKGVDEIGHLAIGLRALALQKDRPFSVQYSDGEVWAWTGKAFANLDSADGASQLVVNVANYRFGQSKALLSLSHKSAATFRAAVSRTLAEHCHLCSRRLTVDGREITSYETDPVFGVSAVSTPLFVLKTPCEQSWQPLRIAAMAGKRSANVGAYKVSVPNRLALSQIDPEEFGTAGILSVFFRQELIRETLKLDRFIHKPTAAGSQILWLSDGVVVQREALGFNSPFGIGLVVSAEGLATDLTGLAPLQNREKQDRLRRSLVLIERVLANLSEQLGTDGFQVSGNKGSAALQGVVGAALLFAVPVAGLAVLTKAGFSYRYSKKLGDELDKAYDEGFKNLLGFLRERNGPLASGHHDSTRQ